MSVIDDYIALRMSREALEREVERVRDRMSRLDEDYDKREARVRGEALSAREDALLAKLAAMPQEEPHIHKPSFKAGQLTMLNRVRQVIEEVMVRVAPKYSDGVFMSSEWDDIVCFHDTLVTALRKEFDKNPQEPHAEGE